MTTNRILGQKYLITVDTTVELLAFPFLSTDVGFSRVFNNATGYFYDVVASGTGAACIARRSGGYAERVLSLHDFRKVSAGGAVGDTTANGGILSSNTTPVMGVDGAKTTTILWAAADATPIGTQIAMPADFDGTRDVFVDMTSVSAGTSNAASFTFDTYWDSGAVVSDTFTGLASTTPTSAVVTIAAADIPDTATRLTIIITPAAHATDTMSLFRVSIRYAQK